MLENQYLGILEILNSYGTSWKINILECLKSWIIVVHLGKSISWNPLVILGNLGIPTHPDSHPCTRRPSWGTRANLGGRKLTLQIFTLEIANRPTLVKLISLTVFKCSLNTDPQSPLDPKPDSSTDHILPLVLAVSSQARHFERGCWSARFFSWPRACWPHFPSASGLSHSSMLIHPMTTGAL